MMNNGNEIYSPQRIIDECVSRLFKGFITVEGILTQDKGGYFKLTEGEHSISVDLSGFDEEVIAKACDCKVKITGYLTYSTHSLSGGIFPKLKTKNLTVLENDSKDNVFLRTQRLINEILKDKKPFGFNNYFLSLVNQNDFPITIALIHGQNAQVQYDFINALHKSFTFDKIDKWIQVISYETILTNDEYLADTITAVAESEKVKAIYILRGGGSEEELNRIGGPETAKAIAGLNIPVYLALGHSLDRPNKLLMKVVSDEFHTPSIAGAELGSLLNLIIEKKSKDMRVGYELRRFEEIQNKLNRAQEQNRLLQEEIRLLKKQKRKFLFLWIATIIAFVLLKIFFLVSSQDRMKIKID